jgi:hypothetical protein
MTTSCTSCAEEVAKGTIEPTDKRLDGLSRLAAKLRGATVEATRLALLLHANPHMSPGTVEFIRTLPGGDGFWRSPIGHFVSKHPTSYYPLVECGSSASGEQDVFWDAVVYVSDRDGTILAPNQPATGGSVSDDREEWRSASLIETAIRRLTLESVAERIAGHMAGH